MAQQTVIKVGSRGPEVKQLQQLLNAQCTPSPSLKLDGVFGAATQQVVIQFQRRQGLNPDGIVGPKTWAALSSATGGVLRSPPAVNVTFFSERGFPHTGVVIEPATPSPAQEWIHYKPMFPKQPEGPGYVARTNCMALIGGFVQYSVDPLLAHSAKHQCMAKYNNTKYKVGIHDCVSMAADFARCCRLKVPVRTNYTTPNSFIASLKRDNATVVVQAD